MILLLILPFPPSISRATAIDSKATVSGAGTISLGSGTTIVKIVVKAENGDTRTYQVSIAKGNGNGSTTIVSPSTGSSTGSQSGSTVGPGGSTGTSSSGSTSGSSSGTSGPGSSTSGTQSSYPEGASGSGKLVTTSSGTTGTSGSTNPGSTGSYPGRRLRQRKTCDSVMTEQKVLQVCFWKDYAWIKMI